MRYLAFFLALYAALAVTGLAWYVKALVYFVNPPAVEEPIQRKPVRIWT